MLKYATMFAVCWSAPLRLAPTACYDQRLCERCVENCVFITSPQGTYALFVTPPRPEPGRGISVKGTISNDPNICMSGPGIKVESWSYSEQPCPK